jgi:glycosyltransferase involved in cell wall biosynthesis
MAEPIAADPGAAAGPVISVVVPTYRRPERLPGLVAALEAQDLGRPFEVIVVDDGSPDGTWAELQRLAAASSVALIPVRLPANRGAAAARNAGWRRGRAPLVAFTDDDCRPAAGWLAAMVAALESAGLVQGQVRPDPADRWGPFSRSLTSTSEDFYATANMGYRREVLEAVGGFDEGYGMRACEDTDLALRAKGRGAVSGFAPDALVHHAVLPSEFRAYLHEKRRWSTVPLVVRRHPELRAKLHSRWFWRASHKPALAAGAGLAGSLLLARRNWSGAIAVGAALGAPYVRYRTRVDPLPGVGPRRRVALLPLALAGDLSEVAVLALGSARHRSLIL